MSREEVVETLKAELRGLGRLVRSVRETPEGLDVLGVNGRTVDVSVRRDGYVSVRVFESGGDEVGKGAAVATGRKRWEEVVMRETKKALVGREASIAEKVAVETADSVYKARLREVQHLTRDVLFLVERHARRQKDNSDNWGYAGDLGYVVQQLKELKETLAVQG
jgi:hypothetical protein